MIITTHHRIWAHRQLLSLVHDANEFIENELGDAAAQLSVTWGLDDTGDEVCLAVTIVDIHHTQTPLSVSGPCTLKQFQDAFRTWRNSTAQP